MAVVEAFEIVCPTAINQMREKFFSFKMQTMMKDAQSRELQAL
jgi:hypothetical protein